MKYVVIAIGIIIVGAGIWFLTQQQTVDAPTDHAMMGMENVDTTDTTTENGSGVNAGAGVDVDVDASTAADVVIDISGRNFGFSESEIRVQEGDRVRVNFTSTSGTHDWRLDGYGVGTEVVTTGNTSSVEFVADEAGEFEFYCSVGNHRQMGMVGTLIVE